MPNKFYAPGAQRAERVGDLFAAIAPRYDLINDLQSFGLHRWWKRRLLQLARPAPGLRALDLCCGTGDVAFALARAGADTTGVDFSAPMLAVAEGKRKKEKGKSEPERVRFIQGDALNLPFAENSFDIVTISYGLRNLASVEAGLREMVRVAKPGGRLLVLDFGKPDNRAWRACYFAYLRGVVPVFGKLFCGDRATHAYILESLQSYPAPREIAAALGAAGCAETHVVSLLGGVMSIQCGVKTALPKK
ncbi:MAG: bifunctional demethylmenaquinone methyltransferase/2-methoxy-6-polyprenyl-1,4-benzoquinol methylase UbiE [Verrucomicrobia bacterium]|nr:bifunctional demethylmenaquinone methyltransferase/2-methoxy-6-polyprenyl-1,4-benzoquinol methylase UbiE [Verrucomicrobiota bacterium]